MELILKNEPHEVKANTAISSQDSSSLLTNARAAIKITIILIEDPNRINGPGVQIIH
jgi:hypothetical protein